MKLVHQITQEVRCYNRNKGHYEDAVITNIYQKKWLWFKWYEYRQIIPLIYEPLYDGECWANIEMETIAYKQRQIAKLWIEEHE